MRGGGRECKVRCGMQETGRERIGKGNRGVMGLDLGGVRDVC